MVDLLNRRDLVVPVSYIPMHHSFVSEEDVHSYNPMKSSSFEMGVVGTVSILGRLSPPDPSWVPEPIQVALRMIETSIVTSLVVGRTS